MECGNITTVQPSGLQTTSSTACNATKLPPQYKRTGRDNLNTYTMKLTMPQTKEQIINIISQADVVADASTLRDNINLSDQGVDSLGMFNIILSIQDHYVIEIPDEDIEGLKTINDLASYIKSKLQ
jgi:acyl carrier protein